jgi:hypothetical protein
MRIAVTNQNAASRSATTTISTVIRVTIVQTPIPRVTMIPTTSVHRTAFPSGDDSVSLLVPLGLRSLSEAGRG